MQNPAQPPFLDLRVNRDFGEILTLYFVFLKRHFKPFSNIFIQYNGLFMIGLMLCSYLLVSGFSGIINGVGNMQMGVESEEVASSSTLMMVGVLGYVLIVALAAALNFALASAYMNHYQETGGETPTAGTLWRSIRGELGNIILFVLLAMGILLMTFVVGFILALIPIVGTLAYYGLMFFVSAWLGVSLFALISEKKGLGSALGEGWDLVMKSFWTCVGVNFILGILNYILLLLLLTAPGVLIGIYAFHQFETLGQQRMEELDTLIFTVGVGILMIAGLFQQALSQWINGVLYNSLHEKKYNLNTRRKIELIGQPETP